MPSVEQSVDIRAPITLVFAAVTDPRRAGEWNPHIVEIRDLAPGPIGEGSSWRQKASMAGQTVDVTCRIVRFNPPYEGVLEISGDQQARITTTCRPNGSQTRLTQVLEFSAGGGLKGAMMARIAQQLIQREMSQSLSRARDTLEREAGP